jgi:nucleoside-diphosphate-sugar epimerase
MGERFLVTGAGGCIGAWTVARLAAEGVPVVALDLSDDPRRLRLVLEGDPPAEVVRAQADVGDLEALERVLDEHEVTHVIHLAALQIPLAKADPPLGARVNVVGTINVLEAVARRADRMAPVVYASSVAAFAPGARDAEGGTPSTLYGVLKRANEGSAAVFHADRGLASVGLRPHTVFGVGRDQGLTSAPTAAMLAAARGEGHEIGFGGTLVLQYAPDVAAAFVQAARAGATGAQVHNLPGSVVDVAGIVAAIERAVPEVAGRVAHGTEPLPFPADIDTTGLAPAIGDVPVTPLDDAVADTVARFRRLLDGGLLPAPGTA